MPATLMKLRPLLRQACLATGLAAALSAGPAHALTFEYSFTAGTSAQAQAAFIEAGNLWSSVLFDPITVRLTVGTAVLGAGVLGQAFSDQVPFSYADVRSALVADAMSSSDATATAALPATAVAMLINRTAEVGSSATPYLDNNGSTNNTQLQMTTANAKALGLPFTGSTLGGFCSTVCDGFIQFNSSFTFDYTRGNGITSGQFDFVGIAAHEIGHALGFVSGVDTLDGNPGFAEDIYQVLSPLDLFRYSSASAAQGAVDFTASTTAKYFSVDGGTTVGPGFATGTSFGDGQQASHWKDSLGLGLLDPTASAGELLAITANDRQALDVIGWNVTAVPEPGRGLLLALGVAAVVLQWRRRHLVGR